MVEMLIENIQKDDNNMMKERERERMNAREFFSHFFPISVSLLFSFEHLTMVRKCGGNHTLV